MRFPAYFIKRQGRRTHIFLVCRFNLEIDGRIVYVAFCNIDPCLSAQYFAL